MFSNETLSMLEFNEITRRLAMLTKTEEAQKRAHALAPITQPEELARMAGQTASARRIFDALGNAPISAMEGMDEVYAALRTGGILTTQQLGRVVGFLNHCRLLRRYCERARDIDPWVAGYGLAVDSLPEIHDEIDRCVRGDTLDDHASQRLYSLRMERDRVAAKIKEKLLSLLRAHPEYFQESFHTQRGGRFVLPVKREYRNSVKGASLDASSTGATVFIEPAAIASLQQESVHLVIEEENEVLRILAQLTQDIALRLPAMIINRDAMVDMDFAMACGRLGHELDGVTAETTKRRELILSDARHPLLGPGTVPLTLSLGEVKGLIITGPNTGGKTVALKTVGLLALMALSGLQVPARRAVIPMFSGVYCDIGDGQSIAQNLSTFSSHVTRLVRILEQLDGRSLVLLDELGSGTDPQEGMGLAVAILETLARKGCLLVATSHYPEIKAFARSAPGFSNARMTFDRATLSPLYRLEMGEAGESCALYIARRLGIPEAIAARAAQIAYPDGAPDQALEPLPHAAVPCAATDDPSELAAIPEDMPQAVIVEAIKPIPSTYRLGDAVWVSSMSKHGILAQERNARGEVQVRIMGKNYTVLEKRLKPFIKSEELYPGDDYDMSIVLDTVFNRKARHRMDKGKVGETVTIREE